MSFSINGFRDNMQKTLKTAFQFAPTRSPKEVLNYVLLDCKDNQTKLYATDLDTSIELSPAFTVEGEGTAVLPRVVLESLAASNDEEFTIECNEATVATSAGNKFQTLNADEFPRLQNLNLTFLKVDRQDFVDAVARTVYATDPDSQRFALSGVAFDLEGTVINVVGTDGRRLSHQPLICENPGFELDSPAIVPAAAIKKVAAVAKQNGVDNMRIGFNGAHAVFQIGSRQIQTRLVEGLYPQWRKVIPTYDEPLFSLPAEDFAAAVRQAMVTCDRHRKQVSMAVLKDSLSLSSSFFELGESRVETPINYEGEELSFLLNPQYLLEICGPLGEAELIFYGTNGTQPFMLKAESYTAVVMPIVKS